MMDKSIYLLLTIFSCLSIFTVFYFNGTGDSADSIAHYQFARYAPSHPELFFNHWAKPLYVLLASPWAQLGFNGIKLFNVLISILTILLTYRIIQKLEIRNAIIGAIILICSPTYFVLTHSGLTEPLFALFIVLGIYLILINKYLLAGLIVSLFPFIRSEGLIFLGVFGLYFAHKGEWKLIPVLLIGHIIYSFAGYFVFDDFLWVFNKIPYATLSSNYGNGNLSHFVVELLYVVGVPVYILFWIGTLCTIFRSASKKISRELQILVFTGFISFFIAHTLFWYLGIFNSMGLKRVLVSVCPLVSIIGLIGYNFVTEELINWKKQPTFLLQSVLTTYIIVFPFTPNNAAINWERDLILTADQRHALKVANYVNQHSSINQRFVFSHPYLSEALSIDHFDNNRRLELTRNYGNQSQDGDIVIWDSWFSVVEDKVSKMDLDNNPKLVNVYNIDTVENGLKVSFSVYFRI